MINNDYAGEATIILKLFEEVFAIDRELVIVGITNQNK